MKKYIHSVLLNEDKCIGCTHCMRRCPTEAIRVRNKKAHIIKERCVDCGECIRVCPSHAQDSITDSLDKLKEFKYNIAIPGITLYGQFSSKTDMNKVYEGIKMLGFDDVFDEGIAADILSVTIKNMIKNDNLPKPIISSFCPAVLRLIQVRFSSLIDNIITVESAMEVAGRIAKDMAMKKYGYEKEEVGVFYLTPCPAKVTSIKNPIGIKDSSLDGAIAINKIYGEIVKKMKDVKNTYEYERATPGGIGWARVGGQSYSIDVDNYIAVDGIENVMNILEEIELGKLDGVVFFEGLACVGGCVGGPLNVENPFIAKSIIRELSNKATKKEYKSSIYTEDEYIDYYLKNEFINWTENIEPRGILTLDDDIQKAIEKLEMIEEILDFLPGLDCGSCGAPTCRALAEDVVRGFANIEDCIFK